ncbi:hypothetical protein EJ03DRAFT_153341 [Teratosphaeria nubilosa]|uniref:Uncharacterized protein n=1 Tax=Teratosphaeria nubilosa TaxID=161662 RepID=A0A6G1LKK1_9PEZI|nr:hypothetical protein EJ03DRAFT_153341 [Teratosphaeria nubilosa]
MEVVTSQCVRGRGISAVEQYCNSTALRARVGRYMSKQAKNGQRRVPSHLRLFSLAGSPSQVPSTICTSMQAFCESAAIDRTENCCSELSELPLQTSNYSPLYERQSHHQGHHPGKVTFGSRLPSVFLHLNHERCPCAHSVSPCLPQVIAVRPCSKCGTTT